MKSNKFSVGDFVICPKPVSFHGLRIGNMPGCVVYLDAKAGVCVQYPISEFFKPCFWLDEELLKKTTKEPGPWTETQISDAILYTGKSPIMDGAMKSWLVAVSRSRPGQALYDACLSIPPWTINLWRLEDRPGLEKWLDANDDRLRRPRMLEVTNTVSAEPVRRPRTEV